MGMEKSHEYEIIRQDKDTIMGRVWWDGKKVQASKPQILALLRNAVTGGKSLEDGVDFLERLPVLLKSGYVTARKVS